MLKNKKLFAFTSLAVAIAAGIAFPGSAQQSKNTTTNAAGVASPKLKPISRKAVAFAVTDAVRDLPDASAEQLASFAPHEINEQNTWVTKKLRPEAASNKWPSIDATLKGKPTPLAVAAAISGPIQNFDGLSEADNDVVTGGRVAPSDQNIAVGPHDVVQTVNDAFRVWDKQGNARTAPKAISSLFAKIGGVCAQADAGDPVVLHDRMSDRWVISQFDFSDANVAPFYECIAVSQTTDPTGAYYAYAFETPLENPAGTPGQGTGQNFPDYPKLGSWPDGYYMTVNQFDRSIPPASGQFNGVGMYAFDRTKMLVGDPSATFIYFNLNLAGHPEGVNSTQPSDVDGFNLPAPGTPNTFVNMVSNEEEIAPYNIDGLRLFDFHADFATPANSTFTERPESPLPLAAFDPRSPELITGSRSEVKQPSPAATPAGTPPAAQGDELNAIPYRVMYRLQYVQVPDANTGDLTENLTASFVVNVSGQTPTTANQYQAGIRYFQLRRDPNTGDWAVYDNATFSPDAGHADTGLNRWLPSAALDNQGNLAVSYSVSNGPLAATPVFPSIYYAGRDLNSTGGLTSETLLYAGTASQLGSGNRWGDYQSLQVDPSDDCTFWTNNQYYNDQTEIFPGQGSYNWRTRIGSFKFPACTAPPQGTLTGTVTSCDTGLPIAGAMVMLDNGFSTTTGPDGKYSMQVQAIGAAATLAGYNVTVVDPSRKCTPSSTKAVVIEDQDITTQDFCLSGIANPQLDPTDPNGLVFQAGGNGTTIYPDSCVTLNVRLLNSGCATATNSVGTLTTTTPGVHIINGTASYADTPVDQRNYNSVPFQFYVDPTVPCGTSVNFTLLSNFNGGTSSVTFSVPTQCGTAPAVTANNTTDPNQTTTNGRLGRSQPPSSCALPKGCPGALGTGPRAYNVNAFTNGPADACVTVSPTSPSGTGTLVAAAYLGTFDPTDLCANYLGVQGSALGPFSFTVPANATFSVVIAQASGGVSGTPYTVQVSGMSAPAPAGNGPCATATAALATQVSPASITLGQTVTDSAKLKTGGSPTGTLTFRAYGPNDSTCSNSPAFVSAQPVNGDGTYVSTAFPPSAVGTYNFIASYSGDGNNPAISGACGDANETVTVSAVPTPTPSPTATATPTASPTATATASPTPTATPTPGNAQNISTRLPVTPGEGQAIGGFIISNGNPRSVLIEGLGPSLSDKNISNPLADPVLELHSGASLIATNDNWQDTQEAEIRATGAAPSNPLEAAMVYTLPAGAYTAIEGGNGNGTGVGQVVIFDLNAAGTGELVNLSTRGNVLTGNNVIIGGFILGNGSGLRHVVVRGLGPSLAARGVANPLSDPTLELRDSSGTLVRSDDNWQDDPAQAAKLTADGLAPGDPAEAAIDENLMPGSYTAIEAGAGDATGVGLVELFFLQ